MNNISATEFGEFIAPVLDETDQIARRYFNNHGDVEAKADSSPVTIADKEIEKFIRDRIEHAYPEHSIMGEEGEDKQTTSPYTWVIDPIDGTKAFIAGRPTFTTLVGLMIDGVPTYGAVSQPVEQKRWSGHAEYKPRNVDEKVLPEISLTDLAIATTSEGYFSDSQLEAIEKMKEQGAIITQGGDAYPYMMLSEGKLDAAFDVGFQPHDIIPLLPILQQAGAWIGFFDEHGASDQITNNVVVARKAEVGQWLLKQLTS